ncbi:hypothetical protein C0995_016520 [Termitomyces sp. Mi166|nr:hypothetical protein C0995_016520 [Termitomyces sp. Mi166\
MSHAGTHRAQASDTQLHLGPPRTVQTTSSSNKFNNISRAHQINLEHQQKKAEAKLREEEKGVTIIAALWKYDEKAKLVEPGVHVRRTKNTKACLDELLEQANNDYHESNAEADELTWANIQLLADCSGASNDYASLSYFDHSKPLYKMFEEFRKQKLTTESNLKASVVKIRIVIIASDSDYLIITYFRIPELFKVRENKASSVHELIRLH